jgi:F0F1-type ATP synthase epsilon subunit
VENARILMALAGPDGKATFYDEDDHTVHELDNGVLVIATDFADGTTYTLTLAEGILHVQVKRIMATMVDCAIDADEEQDLAERLERLVDQLRSAQASRAATQDEAASLASMLVDAGEWEWKDWPENGTDFIQRALDEMETGIVLAKPDHKDVRKVFSSRDFSKAMLQWFRKQLAPHGWTFVAVSPFDEYQAFALVREEHLDRVGALLKLQGRKLN